MTRELQGRDPSIDVLRIVAIVAVVAGHVWFAPPVRLAIYTWHVPVFFVLSGYLASRLRLGELVRRRAQALLLPYAAWLIIIAAVLVGFTDPLRLLAGGAHLPHGFTAFWFVTAFFVAIVAAAVIEPLALGWQWAVALALLGGGYLASDVIALVPFDAGVGLACVVFVVAGRTLRIVRPSLTRPATTGVVMLVAAVALIVSGVSAPLDLKQGDFGTPVVSVVTAILISCGGILVAQRALARVGAGASAIISRLALCGFMVVLTHAAVLYVLHEAGAARWAAFAVALIVPWAVALLALHTPLALVLCGVPRQERHPLDTAAAHMPGISRPRPAPPPGTRRPRHPGTVRA
ncbi:acyltransferase family protein [Agromyces bauzanensis]